MSKANNSLVVGLTMVAALGGLLFGYDTAVISGAVGAIDANFITPRGLAEGAASSLSGWAISCALLGCVIGAMVGGPISTAIGRKGGLLVAAVLFLVGSIGSAWPEFGLGPIGGMGPDALTPFIWYRVLGGVGVGLASMLSPLYIAEIAPPNDRGRLVTFQQMAIVIGITVVYFVNWAIASQGDTAWIRTVGWRWMLASEAIPAAAFFLLLLGAPDSPRWYVMKGQHEKALAVLKRLTHDEALANATLAEIEETLVTPTRPLFSFGALVLVVGVMLSIFQQVVGINAVLYYGPLMFENAGFTANVSFLQTIILGVAMTAFTLVALFTVDRWGRKPLMIAGALIMAVAMFALGSLFNAHAVGLWALVVVVLYIAGFSLSWGPVTWVLLAEIFPNSIKGKAMAIAVAAQWIANLFVSWSFKVMDGHSGLNASFNHGFAYWIYGGMSVLAALFVWRFVPETKGRSLEAIQHLWERAPPHPAAGGLVAKDATSA
ncbi:MAG: D-xylose transporter XylE [Phenylobacterium sp.]|nr:D-xylose transporter XylE [Phenylobacterium sp.]